MIKLGLSKMYFRLKTNVVLFNFLGCLSNYFLDGVLPGLDHSQIRGVDKFIIFKICLNPSINNKNTTISHSKCIYLLFKQSLRLVFPYLPRSPPRRPIRPGRMSGHWGHLPLPVDWTLAAWNCEISKAGNF